MEVPESEREHMMRIYHRIVQQSETNKFIDFEFQEANRIPFVEIPLPLHKRVGAKGNYSIKEVLLLHGFCVSIFEGSS